MVGTAEQTDFELLRWIGLAEQIAFELPSKGTNHRGCAHVLRTGVPHLWGIKRKAETEMSSRLMDRRLELWHS